MKRAVKTATSGVAKLKKPKVENDVQKLKKVTTEDKGDSKQAPKGEFKTGTFKGVNGKYSYDGTVLEKASDVRDRDGYKMPLPKRDADGNLIFEDEPEFKPNMTPEEVLRAGSFGGTYFRPIKSGVTGLNYNQMWLELPQSWLKGLNLKRLINNVIYKNEVNTYRVKCGGDLEMWESSGWIKKQDPYGWFHWYCRFFLGRRTADDERQIKRWKNCTGPKGRWKGNLIGKIARAGKKYDDKTVSPVVRQILQHWGYRLTENDYNIGKKRVKM